LRSSFGGAITFCALDDEDFFVVLEINQFDLFSGSKVYSHDASNKTSSQDSKIIFVSNI
jgi:hypothetical protein